MAAGKMQAWRSIVVAQAGLVWAMTGEGFDSSALADFIEFGEIGERRRSNVMPYNEAVLQQIQDSGFFPGKSE
jgi:hypothetical protein